MQIKKNNYLFNYTRPKRKFLYQTLLSFSIPLSIIDVIWDYHSEVHYLTISAVSFQMYYETSTGYNFSWTPPFGSKVLCKDFRNEIANFMGCSSEDVRIFMEQKELQDEHYLQDSDDDIVLVGDDDDDDDDDILWHMRMA